MNISISLRPAAIDVCLADCRSRSRLTETANVGLALSAQRKTRPFFLSLREQRSALFRVPDEAHRIETVNGLLDEQFVLPNGAQGP
jgi:hypothetical protein